MKLRNGAHVDRILDINPTATSAIAQHNASSPLLRLPLEVKNLIYKYTFGGRLVHIVQNPDERAAKFRNTICRAPISEEEAQENFDSECSNRWYAPANEGRHDCCERDIEAMINGKPKKKPESLSLSLLRCCRQIYNEAHHVPYSANTFSCATQDTLQSFILSLAQGNHENHLAVRSLFIEMVFRGTIHHNIWRKALGTCARYLKNLQKVNISFEWKSWIWMWGARSPADYERKCPGWQSPLMSDILVLKKLPLKFATFVISDGEIGVGSGRTPFRWPNEEAANRWTLAEKQEWARYVKEIILK
ncbi:MAG: hypothetical protein ASARMPRED_008943 [Alectoria sarmentosa]|nr:MAG: hypothetical protein ASARMPRED_008943 [Alectoria sarmentosa]